MSTQKIAPAAIVALKEALTNLYGYKADCQREAKPNVHDYALRAVRFREEGEMSCRSCRSDEQRKFTTEMLIHFSGFEGLDKPRVWAFPKLVVCLDCGFTEFQLEENELHLLVEGSGEERLRRISRSPGPSIGR